MPATGGPSASPADWVRWAQEVTGNYTGTDAGLVNVADVIYELSQDGMSSTAIATELVEQITAE